MASFPILKVTHILEVLDDLDFMKDNRLTRKDFTNPEVSRWKGIYASFFETVSGMPIDTVLQRKKLLVEHRPYMEIHDEGLSFSVFCSILRRLMALCAIPDFTINDIIMPQDEKRLQYIMSGVVNLLKFNNSRIDWLMELEKKNEEKMIQTRSILQANDDLRKQIDGLHIARVTEEAEHQQVKQSVMATRHDMSSIYTKEEEIQAKNKAKVAELSKIDSAKEQLVAKNVELKKRCESLRTEIIASPAQYQDAMTRLTGQKTRIEEETCEQKERFKDLTQHAEQRGDMIDVLDGGLALMRSIEHSSHVLRQCKEQGSEQQKIRADAQLRSQRLCKEADDKKSDVVKSHEVLAKLKLQCENKLSALELTKKDYLQMMESGGSVTKEKSLEFERRHGEINREGEKQLEALDKEITFWKDMQKLILTKLNEACSDLVADWRNLLREFGLDTCTKHTDAFQ